MKIVFATNNSHKLFEVRMAVPDSFEILSLQDINCHDEIPETRDTLQGNALQKAQYVKDHYHHDCFADDTGLEIDALDGKPGVYSARYAGPEADFENNMNKVLQEMKDHSNRKARFRTVIALLLNGKKYFFEGSVEGEILTGKRGVEGFGYDPIFKPEGFDESFAQMNIETKNRISHRGKAVKKLLIFLKGYSK